MVTVGSAAPAADAAAPAGDSLLIGLLRRLVEGDKLVRLFCPFLLRRFDWHTL